MSLLSGVPTPHCLLARSIIDSIGSVSRVYRIAEHWSSMDFVTKARMGVPQEKKASKDSRARRVAIAADGTEMTFPGGPKSPRKFLVVCLSFSRR